MTTHHYRADDGTRYRITIEADTDAMSPRDADNVTIIETSHYSMMSPDHPYGVSYPMPSEFIESRAADGVDMRRMRKYAAIARPEVIAISGIDVFDNWTPTLALSDDDNTAGYIVITRQSWNMCMGADIEPTPELCADIMRQDIEAYNRWASGEYVYFTVEELVRYVRVDTLAGYRDDWETIESLGSFDDEEYALSEAIASLPDDATEYDPDDDGSDDAAIADHLDCLAVGNTHSLDRTTIYHGRIEPLRVCGFHASQLSPALIATMTEGK